MRTFLFTLVLLGMLVTSAFADTPNLPWKTYTEADRSVVEMANEMCTDGPLQVVFLKHEGVDFIMFGRPNKGSFTFIIARFSNGTHNVPDYLFFGHYDGTDNILIDKVETFDQAKHVGPCAMLYAKTS